MHAEALQWIAQYADSSGDITLLDIGGRDINGTVRPYFPNADFTALDILPGVNVDIVADAATWQPDREYDIVTCTEVFEHAAAWREICATAYAALKPGGRFITTCAGPGRQVHSGVDGGGVLYSGEHYENVSLDDLKETLEQCGFVDIVAEFRNNPNDTRSFSRKP